MNKLWITKESKKVCDSLSKYFDDACHVPQKKMSMLDLFMSMVPGILPLDADFLINTWLDDHREIWFENPESMLQGCELRIKKMAEYWFEKGCHDPACKEPEILYAQNKWNNYMKHFVIPG